MQVEGLRFMSDRADVMAFRLSRQTGGMARVGHILLRGALAHAGCGFVRCS